MLLKSLPGVDCPKTVYKLSSFFGLKTFKNLQRSKKNYTSFQKDNKI